MATNATLCYIRDLKNKKTLMLHRNKKALDGHKNKYNGVGGKFEENESPQECAIREIKEETGLDVSDGKLVGILTFTNNIHQNKNCNHWVVFVYEYYSFSGELIDSNEGELSWIDDDKILDLPLVENDYIFLPWIREKKQFFSAKFIFENSKIKDYSVEFN